MVKSHPEVQIPKTPGFSLESWVHQQGTVLQKLLSRARRSTAGKGPYEEPEESDAEEAMPTPDELETQPWGPDPEEDSTQPWPCHMCFLI